MSLAVGFAPVRFSCTIMTPRIRPPRSGVASMGIVIMVGVVLRPAAVHLEFRSLYSSIGECNGGV